MLIIGLNKLEKEGCMNSVLLDTSFCIRLLNSNDVLHKNAVEYFTYFLDNQIEMYL